MVLWYRDSAYSLNDEGNHLADPPSIGAKGTVLVVDAHPDPEHYRGAAAEANPSLIDALPARQQTNDAAFGPVGRYPFQACFGDQPRPGEVLRGRVQPVRLPAGGPDVHGRDRLVPGLRVPPGPRPGGPAVLPRLRRLGRHPVQGQRDLLDAGHRQERAASCRSQFGLGLGGGHVTGTGNPADGLPAGDDGTPGDRRGPLARREADASSGGEPEGRAGRSCGRDTGRRRRGADRARRADADRGGLDGHRGRDGDQERRGDAGRFEQGADDGAEDREADGALERAAQQLDRGGVTRRGDG